MWIWQTYARAEVAEVGTLVTESGGTDSDGIFGGRGRIVTRIPIVAFNVISIGRK